MAFNCNACAVYLALCMTQFDIIVVCLLALDDALVEASHKCHAYEVMYKGYNS